MIDPLITNNVIDGCSFNPAPASELAAANEILALSDAGQFQLVVPVAALAEISNPATPAQVRRIAAKQQFSMPVGLTQNEQRLFGEIHRILTGNGNPDNMRRDAQNVFEAQKYGGHFITNDKRVLARAKEIEQLCGLCIVKPTEFLTTVRHMLADKKC